MPRNVWNYKLYGHCMVQHHLLELLLWPNADGSFRKICNTADRLKELGIYDDYKLCIPLTNSEHVRLHNNFRTDEEKAKFAIAFKGRKHKESSLQKLRERFAGEKNPMFGKDAWAIAASRKTVAEVQATRDSKREKMKAFWASPEGQLKKKIMAAKVSQTKRKKGECLDANNV